MGLLRWPLLCLTTALLAATVSHGVELKDELDSLLCPRSKEMRGTIIDVHKSLDLGAKLLDGSWAPTLEQCASECCHKLDCDLALYKNEGVSQSGKNCYYIKCVSMDNCVMVDHGGFTSIVFNMEKSEAVIPVDNKPTDDKERTGHAPPPPSASDSPVQSTNAPPTSPADDGNNLQPTTSGQSDSGSNPKSDSKNNPSSSEIPPTNSTHPSTEAVEVDSKSALGQGKGHNGVSGNVVNDCGRNGCDGSGVIAIAVVASICFVVIVLVISVLLRKVITDNRRRRFKNVDYLINGMYT